jgi:hypothetical protein
MDDSPQLDMDADGPAPKAKRGKKPYEAPKSAKRCLVRLVTRTDADIKTIGEAVKKANGPG